MSWSTPLGLPCGPPRVFLNSAWRMSSVLVLGVLFAQPPAPTPLSASNKGGGGGGSSNAGGRGGNTGTSGGQAGPAGLSGPSTSTSNNSLP